MLLPMSESLMLDYSRLITEQLRWGDINWYRITHGGKMPPDYVSFRWYTPMWPWRAGKAIKRRYLLVAERLTETWAVLLHGQEACDCD